MNILVEKHIPVRMRDGVSLATDVYRPAEGGPSPTLVMRLPYNKDAPAMVSKIDPMRVVQAGYAIVIQDTRGCYASEGAFAPFFQEPADGADTIAWIVAKPWSNGKIGTTGESYFGATQWLAASATPAALLALAPSITTADYYESWTYQGGAFQLGFILDWAVGQLALGERQRQITQGRGTLEALDMALRACDDIPRLYNHLPLVDKSSLEGVAPYYFDWLAHASYDDYWRRIAPQETYEQITIPALNIGGWFDLFLPGTLANYQGMRQRGGSAAARQHQRLLIGPWAHGNLTGGFPERDYGVMASADVADLVGVQLRWFDHWLKGSNNGVEQDKPVRIFVMGPNAWREEDDWPLPDTRFRPYYLHSEGHANSASGDGILCTEAAEAEDVYLYDPRRPVPTNGGATFLPGVLISTNAGPRDQRGIEARDDVLCYTTLPLEKPVEATGPVKLVLFVSSSTRDTDFTGKLVDVYPNERAESITDGILRARYRESFSAPVLMEPNHVYMLRIDLGATSYVFEAGHRIRLEVSSSNFPRFDRNTNTGGPIATESERDFEQALNRVYHGPQHASHLILPIIERD